jgi:hypothetical protein
MYSRTQNENGTYNTRCLYCFMTIARSLAAEADLDTAEAHHVCPERALAELQGHGKCACRTAGAQPERPN